MDTVLAFAIVLAAVAGIARSVWRRIARPSDASCASGCEGCALASRCGAATASGASLRPAAGTSPSGRDSASSPHPTDLLVMKNDRDQLCKSCH